MSEVWEREDGHIIHVYSREPFHADRHLSGIGGFATTYEDFIRLALAYGYSLIEPENCDHFRILGIPCEKCQIVRQTERRIISLWEIEMACDCEDPMTHLKQRIEGEQK